jgi:hypothetical protein
MQEHATITIRLIGDASYSDIELADKTSLLMDELSGIEDVATRRAAAPEIGKGQKGDAMTVADILLTIGSAAIGGSMQPLINTMKDWIGRQPEGLRLEIKPDGGKTSFTMTGKLDELDPKLLAETIVRSIGDAGAAKT